MFRWFAVLLSIASCLLVITPAPAVDTVEVDRDKRGVEPKPLSENVKKGLEWVLEHQHENGGWSQGEESKHMGTSMKQIKDRPNVADTCMALFALIRSGSTPTEGPYKGNIVKGLEFVCSEVENADKESMYITSIRGTRVQQKIGTFIDTFLAGTILAEVKDKMPDEEGNKRILAALDKTMDKIERNQRDDGTWDNKGWATDLSQSVASRALNVAAQSGYAVDDKVRENAEKFARLQYDREKGDFKKGSGSAGVELYSGAYAINAMFQSRNTNEGLKAKLQKEAETAGTKEERVKAQQMLTRFDENEKDLKTAREAIVKKLDDKQFIAGFGSNGGEEFLSYLNIGETLVVDGGDEWTRWDESMTKNLNHIQNSDGSWTGHHCITGRTFCTSAALLVLMVDRAPMPLAGEIKGK